MVLIDSPHFAIALKVPYYSFTRFCVITNRGFKALCCAVNNHLWERNCSKLFFGRKSVLNSVNTPQIHLNLKTKNFTRHRQVAHPARLTDSSAA